jgi:Proteins of 100 residues with WXG.
MSEPLYKYDPQAIIDGMEDIRTAHNKIDTELDNLETYAEAHMASWDGGSKQAYWDHKTAWNGDVDDMKRVMVENAIPALNHILETYNTTERINTGMWQDG